jgi:polar amino acid transport system substrate-binding protein
VDSTRAAREVTATPSAVVAELAPTGKLRAAINFDNPLLASKDAASGEPGGLSVELARELAGRLGVAIEFVPYFAAGKVVEGVKAGAWDICFLAIDPVRAEQILFTPPYVVIEGAYLVTEGSSIRDNAEVDRAGVRLLVSTGSAYDLFLSRTIRHATIVRIAAAKDVVDVYVAQKLDVAAGVRAALEADARRVPGLRLLPGRFMAIHQAMGTPRGREIAARYLNEFIEEMKASGFVAQSLARNRVDGATVAPAGKVAEK